MVSVWEEKVAVSMVAYVSRIATPALIFTVKNVQVSTRAHALVATQRLPVMKQEVVSVVLTLTQSNIRVTQNRIPVALLIVQHAQMQCTMLIVHRVKVIISSSHP